MAKTKKHCYFFCQNKVSLAHLSNICGSMLRPANELADRAILLLTAVNRFDRQTVRGLKQVRFLLTSFEMPMWKVQLYMNIQYILVYTIVFLFVNEKSKQLFLGLDSLDHLDLISR